MADMSLDELLSSSLKSAAEPAASKGVADAIRARVAAGDTGTAVAGSTAPGWGGSASGILTIVAPIALIVAAGTVGGVLGATGAFGAPEAPRSGDVPAYVTTEQVAPAYVCPGGPEIGLLPAGTRVLAVARDADGAYIGVRNPSDVAATLWFSTADVVLDEGGVDPATLPVLGCPEVTVTVVTPTPTPEPTEEPTPQPTKPPAPTDTTPPCGRRSAAEPDGVSASNRLCSAILRHRRCRRRQRRGHRCLERPGPHWAQAGSPRCGRADRYRSGYHRSSTTTTTAPTTMDVTCTRHATQPATRRASPSQVTVYSSTSDN